MRVLVTGGAGFIGSHVCDYLVNQGHEVFCLDNFNDYYNPAFKEQNVAINSGKSNHHLLRGDITDLDFLKSVFTNKFDKVIHLAARAGVRPSIADPLLYQKVNVEGTANLLEMCRQNGIKDFIFASSSSVYGNNKKIPFSETDPVDNPISPYAATKKAMELLAHTYHHLFGLNCIGLRFFTVYGERGRPDMAPYLFTQWIDQGQEVKRFGQGDTKRDYTYIQDIVSGVVACLDKDFGYEIINLGNNQPVVLSHFIAIVEGLLGKKANIKQYPMQPGDVDITYADIRKAQKLLGYQPKTTIEEGMDKFVSWYKINRQ
ncbi:MAG: GDP-mannose 4,6-dehydratase [Patescibacteria group bacterium]